VSKPITFLHEAQIEMTDAAVFYDAQVRGLGATFLGTIARGLREIQSHPTRWPIIGQNIRRLRIGRFPYGILHRETRDEIIVVAIMHLHRRPGYWTDRLAPPF